MTALAAIGQLLVNVGGAVALIAYVVAVKTSDRGPTRGAVVIAFLLCLAVLTQHRDFLTETVHNYWPDPSL